jgi:hypothetical protein
MQLQGNGFLDSDGGNCPALGYGRCSRISSRRYFRVLMSLEGLSGR